MGYVPLLIPLNRQSFRTLKGDPTIGASISVADRLDKRSIAALAQWYGKSLCEARALMPYYEGMENLLVLVRVIVDAGHARALIGLVSAGAMNGLCSVRLFYMCLCTRIADCRMKASCQKGGETCDKYGCGYFEE